MYKQKGRATSSSNISYGPSQNCVLFLLYFRWQKGQTKNKVESHHQFVSC